MNTIPQFNFFFSAAFCSSLRLLGEVVWNYKYIYLEDKRDELVYGIHVFLQLPRNNVFSISHVNDTVLFKGCRSTSKRNWTICHAPSEVKNMVCIYERDWAQNFSIKVLPGICDYNNECKFNQSLWILHNFAILSYQQFFGPWTSCMYSVDDKKRKKYQISRILYHLWATPRTSWRGVMCKSYS